jgi:large subunit ribosomal protein L20
MTKVTRGFVANRRRSKLRVTTHGRFSVQKQKHMKAKLSMYKHRRLKKRKFKTVWITRLNGFLAKCDLRYSRFMHALKNHNVILNRKSLAQLTVFSSNELEQIVEYCGV